MRDEARRIFTLFVEKAEEMQAEEFTDFLNKNTRISFTYDSKKGLQSRIAPSKASIKSFATNYRLFTSDENISIRSLNRFAQDADISDEWKQNYKQIRELNNTFLYEETNFHIGEGGKPLTRRDIADTFINGWIFHVKDDKKTDTYQAWFQDKFVFHALEQEFITTLRGVYRAVIYIADLCSKELARH